MRERLTSSPSSSLSQNNRSDAGLNTTRPKRESKTPANGDNPSGDWVGTSRDWTRLVLSINDESATRYRYTAAWKRL